jgi:hypothetical protein
MANQALSIREFGALPGFEDSCFRGQFDFHGNGESGRTANNANPTPTNEGKAGQCESGKGSLAAGSEVRTCPLSHLRTCWPSLTFSFAFHIFKLR